jgi:hypothetical protein
VSEERTLPERALNAIKQFVATRPASTLAQIMSACVASLALLGIYIQVTRATENALRASARQVYLAYSQATLNHPQLAFPDYRELKAAADPTELNR